MIAGPGTPEPAGGTTIAIMLVGPVEELIRHHRLVLAIGNFPITPAPAGSISVEDAGLLIGATCFDVDRHEVPSNAIEGTRHNFLGIGHFVAEPYLQSLLPIARTGLDELAARGGLTIEIAGTSYRSSDCFLHVALEEQRLTITAYPQVPPTRGGSN